MESASDSQPQFEIVVHTGSVQWDELSDSLQQQLKWVMNPYIQASPVVLLIGAGASMPFGMPTMAKFPQNFANTLSEIEKHLWDTIVEFSAGFSGVSLDSVNVEHVLTCIHKCQRSEQVQARLEVDIRDSAQGERIQENFPDLGQALDEMTTKVLDSIIDQYGEPADRSKVVECYNPIFEMLGAYQLSTNVFTTNYDLAFEVLVEEKCRDFELVDGFQSSNKLALNLDFVPKYTGAGHAIVLWKMHGSTSWKGTLPAGPIRKGSLQGNGIGGLEAIILPPTQDKTERRKLSMRPFTQMYGSLNSLFMQIEAVKVLLVIGYAFGDQEIVDVIAEGFRAEHAAKLIVVDPNASKDELSCVLSIDRSRITLICDYFGEEHTLETIENAVSSVLS